VVIELARGNMDNSWLGKAAKDRVKTAQGTQEVAWDKARQLLREFGLSDKMLLKARLWLDQGGQCLYGSHGKEALASTGESKARCAYLDTALPVSGLESYRIDHIVPRAKGGPDAYYNLILTTDDSNACKGDRAPWQWFKQDRTEEEWSAYRTRVNSAAKQIGFKKAKLLLSADAIDMVERYQPLAETGWIAKLAQTIVSLYFGWSNGIDANGKRRVLLMSGGVTGRVRRRYYLNSLTGPHAGELTSVDRVQREEWERIAEAEKDRGDKRHHALDAMILCHLCQWANEPEREDEFRFDKLGSHSEPSCYAEKDKPWAMGKRNQIAKLSKESEDQNATRQQREAANREIVRLRDELRKRQQKGDWKTVRDFFQRQLIGLSGEIAPVLPVERAAKQTLDASRYRRSWQRVEKDPVPEVGVLDINQTLATDKMKLADLAFWEAGNGERSFNLTLARMRVYTLYESPHYDAKPLRTKLLNFIKANPAEDQWLAQAAEWEHSEFAQRKNSGKKQTLVEVGKFEDRCTKRRSLLSLGTTSDVIDEFSTEVFADRMADVVIPISGEEAKDGKALELDVEMQRRLNALLPEVEQHFQTFPTSPRGSIRSVSAKAAWDTLKKEGDTAWGELLKKHGLRGKKDVAVRSHSESAEKRPYDLVAVRALFVHKIKKFEGDKLLKDVKGVTDPWIRWQLRQMAKCDPSTAQWKQLCQTMVQVSRGELEGFLKQEMPDMAAWLAFYDKQRLETQTKSGKDGGYRSLVFEVQVNDGFAHSYVDVSKDGSGIYATGGNQGYLIYRSPVKDKSGNAIMKVFARGVRVFESLPAARRKLYEMPDVVVVSKKLWRTGLLFELQADVQSASKVVKAGIYELRSISNGQYCEIKPLGGGDVLIGISLDALISSVDAKLEILTQ
jgi:hypothetical protein